MTLTSFEMGREAKIPDGDSIIGGHFENEGLKNRSLLWNISILKDLWSNC